MIRDWQIFDGVEVQVFKPVMPSREAILFCPGFPGAGAALFENAQAQNIVNAGYSLYVIHHKGTRTDAPQMSEFSINNADRLAQAMEKGEKHLGGGAATMDELLIEPLPVLKRLCNAFKAVHVIGNSFGALSALWSLTEKYAPRDKIGALILLAGAQGIDDGSEDCIMRIWKKEFIEKPVVAMQLDMPNTDAAIASIQRTYKELPGRVMEGLSEHIRLTYITIKADELLKVSDTMAFRAAIGGRGDMVIDAEEKGNDTFGAHYTPNLKTEDLLQLVRALK